MSIRLWELDSGKSLAVYTPEEKITTCEILKGGQYLAIALENKANVITLKLRGGNVPEPDKAMEAIAYGKQENCGKVFDLKQ